MSLMMDFQPVLVEREDHIEKTLVSSSGILLDNKFVITTSNCLSNASKQEIQFYEDILPGKLYEHMFKKFKISINVVWKNINDLYTVKRARVFAAFVSENIKNTSQYVFQSWAIDSIDNNRDLSIVLSQFLVLTFDDVQTSEDFKIVLRQWWDLVGHLNVNKGDTVHIESSPFGNRNFINSYSKGIVSNIMGENSCLVFSDCPSTPGSEGSPVYLDSINRENKFPVGIVLSSTSWWKGEWLGITVILDVRSIILELIDVPIKVFNINEKMKNVNIISGSECSLVQIYCSGNWGTAILLDVEKGIFITNSHVVDGASNMKLYRSGNSYEAELIYKTPANEIFDLAIVKSSTAVNKEKLRAVGISRKSPKLGNPVYSAGFSIFPKECHPSSTISKGYISNNNRFMLRTTCSVHPGASGGAILDEEGLLLGIIVCNTKLQKNHVVYPRINMAVPFSAIMDVVFKYLSTNDASKLSKLHTNQREAEVVWKQLEGKL